MIYWIVFMGSIIQGDTRAVYSNGFPRLVVQTPAKPFQATVSPVEPQNNTLTIQLPSADALEGVKGFYKVYLDFPNKPGKFDTVLVFAKDSVFPLREGGVLNGTAALIETSSFEKIEDATIFFSQDHTKLTLGCASLATPGVSATLLGSHFLPVSFPTEGLPNGFGEFPTYFGWSSVSLSGRMLPSGWRYVHSDGPLLPDSFEATTRR